MALERERGLRNVVNCLQNRKMKGVGCKHGVVCGRCPQFPSRNWQLPPNLRPMPCGHRMSPWCRTWSLYHVEDIYLADEFYAPHLVKPTLMLLRPKQASLGWEGGQSVYWGLLGPISFGPIWMLDLVSEGFAGTDWCPQIRSELPKIIGETWRDWQTRHDSSFLTVSHSILLQRPRAVSLSFGKGSAYCVQVAFRFHVLRISSLAKICEGRGSEPNMSYNVLYITKEQHATSAPQQIT